MQALKKLLKYLKPYWVAALVAPIMMMLEVAMDLLQPRLMETIVDQGIANLDLNLVIHTGLLMIGVALVGMVGGVACTYFAIYASAHFSADVRSALYRKVQTFSFGNLDALQTGQLVTRLTNDVNQVGMLVQSALRIMVRAPLILLGSLVLAVITSPSLAVLLLALMPLLLLLVWWVTRKASPLFSAVQAGVDGVNTVMQENLTGVRVVKAFVRGDFEKQRFGVANDVLMDRTIQALQLMAVVMPAMSLVMNLGLVSALWFGGMQVNTGSLQVGQLVAFINYLLRALGSVMMVAMVIVQLTRAVASADRIAEVLDSHPDVQDAPNALTPAGVRGRVVFENVSFGYDGEDEAVLKGVSFAAEPGETVAILGATGSGKTSLVNLIPRFYDVKDGRVTIDGQDVRALDQAALRQAIGVALQEVVLFSGSVRDNIRYGRPEASDAEVEEAARAAQADEFIRNLPEGYDTLLGQRGVNLSGGQKQRLAIARALLVKPAVLILDDSTSAVDATTEAQLQRELQAWMRGRTSFVIAQRISTVLNADRILVLDNGRLAAQGTHNELMRSSAIYREIYDSQLGSPVAA
ncbi:MAG: ABC transporter ATP-binding protein [Anaerolineae bacterium]|nr:ABC transporter ATP-binding protein [Anaerolineae bacterium]